MKISILTLSEEYMNILAQAYRGEGLIGFAVGERTGGEHTIDNVYKNDFYTGVMRGIPPWGELRRFLDDNEEGGRLFPWLLKRSYRDIDAWMRGFRASISNDPALISIPEISSTDLYVHGEGREPIEICTELPPHFGRFSKEFARLYLKLESEPTEVVPADQKLVTTH